MRYIITILFVLCQLVVFGQEDNTNSYLSEIQKYDVSDLWTLTNFEYEFESEITKVERQEPLGYIGDDYQRFYIHFISVIQNPSNKLQYFVYGKTRVKSNICSFNGLIKISTSQLVSKNEHHGYIKGDYEFYEDPDQKHVGVLKGVFETYFFINKNGEIQYDAFRFISDDYKNNQFEGKWISYIDGESRNCSWGDYRIPDSKMLDIGAGEFSVSEKYVSNGWISYMIANGASPDRMNVEEAKKFEKEHWWLDKD